MTTTERPPAYAAPDLTVGARVAGCYLGQPISGTIVHAAAVRTDRVVRVVLDQPVRDDGELQPVVWMVVDDAGRSKFTTTRHFLAAPASPTFETIADGADRYADEAERWRELRRPECDGVPLAAAGEHEAETRRDRRVALLAERVRRGVRELPAYR